MSHTTIHLRQVTCNIDEQGCFLCVRLSLNRVRVIFGCFGLKRACAELLVHTRLWTGWLLRVRWVFCVIIAARFIILYDSLCVYVRGHSDI